MLRFSGDSIASVSRGYSTGCIYADPERAFFIVIEGTHDDVDGEQFIPLILPLICARLERETGSLEERIKEAITLANNELFTKNQDQVINSPLICSVTAAIVGEEEAIVGHVGSTRAYLIEPTSITHITSDYGIGGQEALPPDVTQTENPSFVSSVIEQSIGLREHEPEDPNFIELAKVDFTPESALLLCSSNVVRHLSTKNMLQIIQRHPGNRTRVVHALTKTTLQVGCEKSFSILFIENKKFAPALRRRKNYEVQSQGWTE